MSVKASELLKDYAITIVDERDAVSAMGAHAVRMALSRQKS